MPPGPAGNPHPVFLSVYKEYPVTQLATTPPRPAASKSPSFSFTSSSPRGASSSSTSSTARTTRRTTRRGLRRATLRDSRPRHRRKTNPPLSLAAAVASAALVRDANVIIVFEENSNSNQNGLKMLHLYTRLLRATKERNGPHADDKKTPQRAHRALRHPLGQFLRRNARRGRNDGSRESVSRRKCFKRRRDDLTVRVAVQSSEIGTERRTETESEHAVLVPLPRDDHRGTGDVDPAEGTGVSEMILDLRSSFGFLYLFDDAQRRRKCATRRRTMVRPRRARAHNVLVLR